MRFCTSNKSHPSHMSHKSHSIRSYSAAERDRYGIDRRRFLSDAFCGFGSLALASMLHRDAQAANSLAPHTPPRPAKADSVIFLFMAGGPSHVDTFDPKPLLNKLDGQPRPAEFGEAKYQFVRT